MKLDLDSLFTLFEELENSEVLTEELGKPGKEQLLSLFKLQISENWGKLGTVEREELSRIVQAATAGQTDVVGRLKKIEEQMSALRLGTLGKIRNPTRILSQIILLETFNRLFKSFQPSPAGFINEGLLSVFYGGKQEDAGEANKAFQIGDVIASDGTPISIKTKIKGSAMVDGSIKNLYHSINRSPTNKVYFDIFLKESKEGKNGNSVGALTYMRFFVDATNINQFLDRELFMQDPDDPKKLKLRAEFQGTFLDSSQELEEVKQDIEGVTDIIVNNIDKFENLKIDDKFFNNLGLKVGKNTVSALLRAFDQKISSISKENPELAKRLASFDSKLNSFYLQAFRGGKEMKYSEKGKIETEFNLDEQNWMRFVKSQGTMVYEPVILNFSDVDIEQTIQKAVEQIDEKVTSLFNTLASFTSSVQEYLTSIKSNRGLIGTRAQEQAKILPSKTEAVVQVATDSEESNK